MTIGCWEPIPLNLGCPHDRDRSHRRRLADESIWPREDEDDVVDVDPKLDGRTIHASGNSDLSYFDDPAFDRQLDAANRLSGPRRYRAYRQLQLERDLVPAAAFATDARRDFFSARIGCQLHQPVYGIDVAALCLR